VRQLLAQRQMADNTEQHEQHMQQVQLRMDVQRNIQYIRHLLSWIGKFPLVVFGGL
jgi:hypothetical protein